MRRPAGEGTTKDNPGSLPRLHLYLYLHHEYIPTSGDRDGNGNGGNSSSKPGIWGTEAHSFPTITTNKQTLIGINTHTRPRGSNSGAPLRWVMDTSNTSRLQCHLSASGLTWGINCHRGGSCMNRRSQSIRYRG